MTLTEQLSEHEISQVNLQLLRWCFSEIPASGSVNSYSFSEDELERKFEQFQEALNPVPTNRHWKEYFEHSHDESLIIDDEKVVQAWCSTLKGQHGVDVEAIEQEPESLASYSVIANTINRGSVRFELFFNAENLLKAAPKPSESKFLIWFLEPESGDNRSCVYAWHKVSQDDFWQIIKKKLIEHQRAPDEAICQLNSHAVKQNFDGVKDNIKLFGRTYGEEIRTQPQLIDNVQCADVEVNLSAVDLAIELDEEAHLLICECTEVGSETLHAHLVVDGEATKPNSNSSAEKIVAKSHSKTRLYNDLFDDREGSSKFIRLAVVMIAVGALPALSSIVDFFFGSNPTQISKIYGILGSVVLVVSLIFFGYTILPLVQLRMFSWDSTKTTTIGGRMKALFSSNKWKILSLL